MLEFEINTWFQRGHIEKKLTKDNPIDNPILTKDNPIVLQNFHMYANIFHFFFPHKMKFIHAIFFHKHHS
jgi:hypothetical protein